MKNLIKRISLFIVVLVSCLVFFGCSAEYSLTLKKNGTIEATVNLNLTELDDDSASKVTTALVTYFVQLDKAFEKNTLNLYSHIFDYEKLRETYKTDKELISYILSYNDFLVNKTVVEPNLLNNKIIKFSKSFVSMRSQSLERTLTAYYLYFYPSALSYSEEEKDIVLSVSYKDVIDDIPLSSTLTAEKNIFISKIVQTSNPFYYNAEEPKFLEDCILGGKNVTAGTTLKSYLTDVTGLDEEMLNLIFNFTTPYSRVHSNGTVTENANGYTHSWRLGGVDSQVVFYRLSARPIIWYAIGGGIGIVIIIVGLIVWAIDRNKKKKVGLEALKKIDELANSKK